jgi:predicted molibdopterin-dependent oxidoreductase YjgC
MLLEVSGGELTGILPQKGHPVSDGTLCVKGWTAHEFVRSPSRLTAPLVREGESHGETSWDQAVGLVASELGRVVDEHGPDSVAFICSAKCTNEENYLVGKLARAVVGTNNIDHCARL